MNYFVKLLIRKLPKETYLFMIIICKPLLSLLHTHTHNDQVQCDAALDCQDDSSKCIHPTAKDIEPDCSNATDKIGCKGFSGTC